MSTEAVAVAPKLERFHWPGSVIARFVSRRTMRSAALWAVAFGALVASKSAGYAQAAPTLADRTKLAVSFSNNVGLSVLLGKPHQIQTVTGFAVWNTLGVMTIIGSIWAFLLASKTFRGDEDAGRWELLLSGQTTARRAGAQALAGLGASLTLLYVVAAAAFILVGRIHTVNYGAQAGLFFAAAAVAGAVLFMAIGALMSQIMPTRGRAASASAVIFGIFFLVRGMGDITSARWLLDISPLGWIEKLQPLYGSQAIWLLPLAGLLVVVCAATVWLAGRRDLGASFVADRDSAPAHTALLNRPVAAALRLTRGHTIGWLVGITFVATFFGFLTKSAAQAFSGSANIEKVVSRLTQGNQRAGATVFLGIVFFFVMLLTMAFVASSVAAMREDEAEGYLDNLLVRPVGRVQWLVGRALLIGLAIILAGGLGSLGAWLAASSQHIGIGYATFFKAGLNAMVPAGFTLGFGVLALGLVPRLTSLFAYGIIAWGFLIQILSSGLNLNHWLIDTSLLHHVTLAPAVNPDWGTDLHLLGVALVLGVIGALIFNRRDLQNE